MFLTCLLLRCLLACSWLLALVWGFSVILDLEPEGCRYFKDLKDVALSRTDIGHCGTGRIGRVQCAVSMRPAFIDAYEALARSFVYQCCHLFAGGRPTFNNEPHQNYKNSLFSLRELVYSTLARQRGRTNIHLSHHVPPKLSTLKIALQKD